MTEKPDAIEIPSKAASMALARAAADNQEAIREQVEEASHYIRMAKIEVDEKVAGVQEKINKRIEQALVRVDEVKNTVSDVLEGAQELSFAVKGELEKLIDKIAEKLLEAVQVPLNTKSEIKFIKQNEATALAIDELNEKAEELSQEQEGALELLALPLNGSHISMRELIAGNAT